MGSFIRARAKWVENGEKPTKYFCSLENRHFTNKKMSKLITYDGRTLTQDEEILLETKFFYEKLYTFQDHELLDMDKKEFQCLIDNRLTDEEALNLEGTITLTELTYCLIQMKNNKSPGSDGFSVEFFKFFWN